MATSSSYDSVTTESEIINDAFTLINAHDPGETLPSDKYSHGRRVLNQLVNFMSINEGLWMRTEVSVTLTPGTTSYTMGVGQTIDTPKPMRLVNAYRTDGTTDIPIEHDMSRADYMGLPNKSQQGAALSLYYDKQRDTGTLYVWPTGDTTNNTLKVTTSRPIQDFDASGNNPDLPREWVLMLTYMLAEKLAPTYLGGVIPPSITAQVNSMTVSLLRYDEETSGICMQPA